MIAHSSLGRFPFERSKKLYQLITNSDIKFSGNKKLKIYGRLNCRSGMRMKIGNRVFFRSAEEAERAGFRPCGHCMKKEYLSWLRR